MNAATDLERAREALHKIPPDLSREEWARALMAAKAAGLPFEEVDAWSEGAGNYDPRGMAETWRSIKADGGIGAGTLYRMAADHGGCTSTPRRHSSSKAPRKAEPHRAPRPGMGAAEVWNRLQLAPADHPYITAKAGRPDGLRVVPDGDPLRIAGGSVVGWLVVPVLPVPPLGGSVDAPVSLQFIPPPGAGKKLNLPDASMSGVFIVGELVRGGTAYLCEGIGQAWACWKATGTAAVVCFGWGRVRTVAAELRQLDPAARLVLVPDTGKERNAETVSLEVGAEYVFMPEGSPPNFDANDYAAENGYDALEVLLASAKAPPKPEPPPPPWHSVSVADLCTAEIPPQAWAWHEYIPAEEVTLLGAHDGTGKSTMALMLLVSVAIGLPLFGVATRPARVVFFSAEDGADTVRRRLRGIVQALGVDVQALADRVEVLDATESPELAGPLPGDLARTRIGLTQSGVMLKEHMAARPGALLIVDNASDAFAGNENARPEVRAFVRLLASMVRRTGGAVLLLAHVDKGTSRGERAGSESYSGSTAWHNSARSRLYLSRDKDSGALLLEHQKSNHGPKREPMHLVWPRDGLPTLDRPVEGVVRRIEENNVLRAVLRLIHEFTQRGEWVSTATAGPNTAAQSLRHSKDFPTRMHTGEFFELLRSAERRGLLERIVYINKQRRSRERWSVTQAGLESVGIPSPAQVAQVAQVAASDATSGTGNLLAQVVQVPALGGVGGMGCAQTCADPAAGKPGARP